MTSATATPPWYFSAFTVATTTAALGRSPESRHLRSKNFSAPRSAPKPASVTTTSLSASAVRVASTELHPCAMLANGPPCTKTGECSRVCTRLGCRAFASRIVSASCASRSAAVTGTLSRVWATTTRPIRSLRSASDVARQKIAISSLATTMSQPSSRGNPLPVPPSPTTTWRSARSFMSTTRFQVTARGSMPSALPWWTWLSISAANRLLAAAIAAKSPVKWRLMSVIGTTWA